MYFPETFYNSGAKWSTLPKKYNKHHANPNLHNRPQPTQPVYDTRAVNFAAIKAKKLDEEGLKVTLSDKSVKELVKVNIPDPDDKELAKIENRSQKTKSATVDLVNNNLTVKNQLLTIKSALDQNLVVTEQQTTDIVAALYKVLEQTPEPVALAVEEEDLFTEVQTIVNPENNSVTVDYPENMPQVLSHKAYKDNEPIVTTNFGMNGFLDVLVEFDERIKAGETDIYLDIVDQKIVGEDKADMVIQQMLENVNLADFSEETQAEIYTSMFAWFLEGNFTEMMSIVMDVEAGEFDSDDEFSDALEELE